MKTIVFFLLSAFSTFAQVSTFNGHKTNWGWSSKAYSKDAVVKILDTVNLDTVDRLSIQKRVDAVTEAEFLWKISPDLVREAEVSGSSYIVAGAKVSNLEITLQPGGKGEIRLYSQGALVGRVRCHSAATLQGKNSQPNAGNFTVTDKEEMHISKEFKGAKMPFALCVDPVRGIWIHCGDISEVSGVSGGCVRVSKPVGRQLFDLIARGIPGKVTRSQQVLP